MWRMLRGSIITTHISYLILGCLWQHAWGIEPTKQPALEKCRETQGNWSEDEKSVWLQLCESGSGGAARPGGQRRVINPEFLSRILADQALVELLPTKGARVRDVKFNQYLNITSINLSYLRFENCEFAAGVGISDAELKYELSFSNSKISKLDGNGITSPVVTFWKSDIGNMMLYSLEIKNGISFWDTKVNMMGLRRSHISGSIDVIGTSRFQRMDIISDKIDGIFAIGSTVLNIGEIPEIDALAIFNTRINGPLIVKSKWLNGGSLSISNMYAERFYLPPNLPKSVQYGGFEFGSWVYEGKRSPKDVRDFLDSDKEFHPSVYTRVAASSRAEGLNDIADEITIAKRQRERENSSWLGRVASYVSLITVGYGLRPEYGIACFFVLILIGFVVFRSGEKYMTSPHTPQSWLIFTIDTVIPLIHLDRRNDDIFFAGWRQYFLYFMRVSSAVLAYLVFKVLEKAFSPE